MKTDNRDVKRFRIRLRRGDDTLLFLGDFDGTRDGVIKHAKSHALFRIFEIALGEGNVTFTVEELRR